MLSAEEGTSLLFFMLLVVIGVVGAVIGVVGAVGGAVSDVAVDDIAQASSPG